MLAQFTQSPESIQSPESNQSTEPNIYSTLGSILFIADHKSPNWVSIQYDNSTNRRPPASMFSPFYTSLGSPPIHTVYNSQTYLITTFTRKTGEVTRVVSRDNIGRTVKKEIEQIIDSPNVLYQDKCVI
tara:strand:+ start:267 stop:653 length:387 start_codon:yes stop_codon:yes gene_type:complete